MVCWCLEIARVFYPLPLPLLQLGRAFENCSRHSWMCSLHVEASAGLCTQLGTRRPLRTKAERRIASGICGL